MNAQGHEQPAPSFPAYLMIIRSSIVARSGLELLPMYKLSASLRSISPSLWQYLKYKQYMLSKDSEREIHFVERYIRAHRAAIDVGVHLGFYTRHFTRFAKSV